MDREELTKKIKKDLFTITNCFKSNYKKNQLEIEPLLDLFSIKSDSFKEKVYLFLNNLIEPPTCNNKNCNNHLKFVVFNNPYKQFCSIKCMSTDSTLQLKKEATTLLNFGVKNPFQSTEVKAKIIETNISRYGVKSPRWTVDNREKAINTNITRYGVDNPAKSKIVKDRSKETCISRYGESHPWKVKSIRDAIKITNFKKFGFENAAKCSLVKLQTENTCIQKYGVPFYTQSTDWSNKFLQTKFEKAIIRYKDIVSPLFTFTEWKNRDVNNSKLQWSCNTCNTVFYSEIADGIIPRCTTCFPLLKGSSIKEKEVATYIKTLAYDIIENTRKLIPPKEIDMYVQSKNLAIEFNGIYWHSELNGCKKDYHINKTINCKENNIDLIHIFEDEWDDKQEIIKSILASKLDKNKVVIGARSCIVTTINSTTANDFYRQNHLQGACNSSINLGLFYKDKLVSCLSFSKPRFNKKYDWEITRYANLLGYKIHGAFSKLWKNKPAGSIITYSDRRYFTGSIYRKTMTELPPTKPAYFYVKNGVRYNRLGFQKHKLEKILPKFDASLTEWENMQLNGFDRIWDCGNWCFEFKV